MHILKRTLFTTGICLFSLASWCQSQIDTSFRHQMNTIFGNLDKSKVPTGILRDYAMEFANLENVSGTAVLADSNYGHTGSFWQVYNTLISGRVHSSATALILGDTLDNRWYAWQQPGYITLCGLHFLYDRFKDDAYPGYITITSNKLYDKYVSGVWQNPYQTEKTFIISPSKNIIHDTSFNILLPSTLWLTNSSGTLSINVSDGLGYRTLTPGTPLSVNYSSSGLKEWTYRLQIAGGTYLYAHSLVGVDSAYAGTSIY